MKPPQLTIIVCDDPGVAALRRGPGRPSTATRKASGRTREPVSDADEPCPACSATAETSAGGPPAGQRPGEGEAVARGVPRYAINLPLADTDGDVEGMAMYAGQGVVTIDAVEPAAAIVERFAAALRST